MLWLMASTLGNRVVSFGVQILLGWLLSKEDFGIYAAAISIASLAQGFLDGGARNIVIQKGERHWSWLSGPAFWIATAYNAAAGAAVIGLAALMHQLPFSPGTAFDDPRLPLVVAVIGIAFLISAPETMFRSKLSMQLRFRAVSGLTFQKSLVQNISMLLFAFAGLGPLSFALPLLVVNLYGAIVGYWLTREDLWRRPVRFRAWPPLLSRTKWLILAAASLAILRQGDYLALGGLVPTEVLGVYFFAFQIVMQLQVLLGVNMQMVLLPALSRIQDEPARFREAVLKATTVLALIGCAAGIGMGVVYPPLETMIWQQKWAASVLPVQLFACCFPFRMMWSIVNGAMMARGDYRGLAGLTLLSALGLLLTAAAAGLVWKDADPIAAAVGVYFVVGLTLLIHQAYRRYGITFSHLAWVIFPAWLIALACGALTLIASDLLSLAPPLDFALRFWMFTILYIMASRLLIPQALLAVIAISPAKLARPLKLLVLLK